MNTLFGILLDVFLFYFQPLAQFFHVIKHKASSNKPKERQKHHREKVVISRGDIKNLMERLGIVCDLDNGGKLQERYGESDVSRLFEQEPSLEEIKETFDVFDENKDGFIDGQDLQRVLCVLGFNEGFCQVEKCKEMIKAVTKDVDGKIDFNEFIGFMEKCFC